MDNSYRKHVVLITSGQPATNPRLVKEADSLVANNYRVTVLYCYWNNWATEADRTFVGTRAWKAIRVAGTPADHPVAYRTTIFLQKIAINITKVWFNNPLRVYALSRATFPLVQASKQIKADFYLAHNLAALPAAVLAAKKYQVKAGFDAEDYHRAESRSGYPCLAFRLKVMLEDQYIPQLNYFTTSSAAIAELYQAHYQHSPLVIRNLLPVQATSFREVPQSTSRTLKLFWFSQTIGPDRGIELIIESLKHLRTSQYELHLLGEPKPGYISKIYELAASHGIPAAKLHFHMPLPPQLLYEYSCGFDIGLASEMAHCLNNDVALSNKLFTYIQAGLAVVLSDTKAQKAFYQQYPQIGRCYKKKCASHLGQSIQYYLDHDRELQRTKQANYTLGKETLNWERESVHFINKVRQTTI